MKHIQPFKLFEAKLTSPDETADRAYKALIEITGLPEAFKRDMLLGKGCASGILWDIEYNNYRGAMPACPISVEDYNKARQICREEAADYPLEFDKRYKESEDEEGRRYSTSEHLRDLIPYQRLISLLTALERNAIKRGDTRVNVGDFTQSDTLYAIDNKSVKGALEADDLGKVVGDILISLGFERSNFPSPSHERGEGWIKVK